MPAVPAGMAVPSTTSSMSSADRPARSTAARMAWPASVGDLMLFREPWNARPIGVRAVETITASVMPFLRKNQIRWVPRRAASMSRRDGSQAHPS